MSAVRIRPWPQRYLGDSEDFSPKVPVSEPSSTEIISGWATTFCSSSSTRAPNSRICSACRRTIPIAERSRSARPDHRAGPRVSPEDGRSGRYDQLNQPLLQPTDEPAESLNTYAQGLGKNPPHHEHLSFVVRGCCACSAHAKLGAHVQLLALAQLGAHCPALYLERAVVHQLRCESCNELTGSKATNL